MIKATHPLEFVIFFDFKVNTLEGPAFIFLGVDAFSGFVFNLGLESERNSINALKSIYFLLEDPEFLKLNTSGFTLVLNDYKDIDNRISEVLKLVNGKIVYDVKFVNKIARPVIKSLNDTFSKKRFM